MREINEGETQGRNAREKRERETRERSAREKRERETRENNIHLRSRHGLRIHCVLFDLVFHFDECSPQKTP